MVSLEAPQVGGRIIGRCVIGSDGLPEPLDDGRKAFAGSAQVISSSGRPVRARLMAHPGLTAGWPL